MRAAKQNEAARRTARHMHTRGNEGAPISSVTAAGHRRRHKAGHTQELEAAGGGPRGDGGDAAMPRLAHLVKQLKADTADVAPYLPL